VLAWGPKQNYAKVGHTGSVSGSRDLLGFFGPLRISAMAEAGQDTPVRAVRVVHSMQPSPSYSGLLFIVISVNLL